MNKERSEYQRLLDYSVEIGKDASLVQASCGNTSIKHDGTLWIKAANTWLANARSSPIMVPVLIDPLLAAMAKNDPSTERPQAYIDEARNFSGLRPSIETAMHAAIPQRIVIHVHNTSAIALACQANAEQLLSKRLVSYNWQLIPYARAGLPLAREIVSSLSQTPDCNVFLLANHGLIVAADTIDEASSLLTNVCKALDCSPRRAPTADVEEVKKRIDNSQYLLPEHEHAHASACDEISLAIATGGRLYADHVIMLGAEICIAKNNESAQDIADRHLAAGQPCPTSILFPNLGVAVLDDQDNKDAQALVRCLADVTARIPSDAQVSYLSSDQINDLLTWEDSLPLAANQ